MSAEVTCPWPWEVPSTPARAVGICRACGRPKLQRGACPRCAKESVREGIAARSASTKVAERRQKLLALIASEEGNATPAWLAARTCVPIGTITCDLRAMVASGQIEQRGRGLYRVTGAGR